MDKKYIAGIFESSGHITFRKDIRTKNSIFPVIIINSQNITLLENLKNIYGGSLKKGKYSSKLIISHRKALSFINDIYDFLLFKKEIADIIIDFYNVRFTRKYEAKRKKDLVRKFIQLEGFEEKNTKKGNGSIIKWLEEKE
ncbi:hypothetical protein [Hydrogenothermus marinus]|uniref:LAGLIDADG DNA endonuclease family protein n=1 Tax=Hydrogenothermus marinus TaxID=133270 RepID=A0A3M0B5U7_9AQUI|nr:hypothetical protein [Hydrogenothermus marinus]RMA92551.1 hypothetical protein CLV39_1600 [Hydrogenothermus marinus]